MSNPAVGTLALIKTNPRFKKTKNGWITFWRQWYPGNNLCDKTIKVRKIQALYDKTALEKCSGIS